MSGAAPRTHLADCEADVSAAPIERKPPSADSELVVASHDALFDERPSAQCDACGMPLGEAEDVDGYNIPGRGAYLWARANETRIESVPLCPGCASAIGITALGRWEIEEEEG